MNEVPASGISPRNTDGHHATAVEGHGGFTLGSRRRSSGSFGLQRADPFGQQGA
jgi:hypothetical protein